MSSVDEGLEGPDRLDLYDFLAAQVQAGLMTWQQVDAMLSTLELQPPQLDVQRVQTIYERLGGLGRPDWHSGLEVMRSREAPPAASGEPLLLPPSPAWWAGASPEEITDIDLYPGGPDGSDLLSISDTELTRRALRVDLRLGRGQESRWLLGYFEKVLEERRRRRASRGATG